MRDDGMMRERNFIRLMDMALRVVAICPDFVFEHRFLAELSRSSARERVLKRARSLLIIRRVIA